MEMDLIKDQEEFTMQTHAEALHQWWSGKMFC
jgi:hypothetical protein